MAQQKTGRRIILKDKTVYENGECGYADGNLWCYVPGVTAADVLPEFLKPSATKRIVFEYGEMSDVYEDFTVLSTVLTEPNQVSICMKKAGEQ
jgi:hypothetical protein